jgi:hypothetical protein
MQIGGYLVSKVMHISKTAIKAQTASWWKRMSCVSAQEDIAVLIFRRNLSTQDPRSVAEYIERDLFAYRGGNDTTGVINCPGLHWMFLGVEVADQDLVS